MARLNSNGNFIGRHSKDGEWEEFQMLGWLRNHAPTPIGFIGLSIIISVSFFFLMFLAVFGYGIIVGITTKGTPEPGAYLLMTTIISIAVNLAITYCVLSTWRDLLLYSLWHAIAATISIIIFTVPAFLWNISIDKGSDASCIVYNIVLVLVSIAEIAYNWYLYKNY